MNFFFLHYLTGKPGKEPGKCTLVSFREQDYNIIEGCEFLDDGIRMQDQPLIYAKKALFSKARRIYSVPEIALQ